MAVRMPSPWKSPSGIYYLRERVPRDVQTRVKGKRLAVTIDGHTTHPKANGFIKVSLRTRDAHTAKDRYKEASQQVAMQLDAHRKGPTRLNNRQITALAGVAYHRQVQRIRDEPGPAHAMEHVRSQLASIKSDPWKIVFHLTPMVDELLATEGLVVDEESHARLSVALAGALEHAFDTLSRNARGDYSDDPMASRYPLWTGTEAQTPATPADVWQLFDAWAAERKPAKSTVDAYRANIREFVDFVKTSDATRFTPENVIAWKDALVAAETPTKTINAYKLAALKAVLNYATKNRRLAVNPAAGVSVGEKQKKAGARMRGYSDSEARTILTAALAESRPAYRWVPWLCALSGARVAEICQLRKEDIQQEGGVWSMHITADAGPLKNAASERVVPLHPALISRGFLDLVRSRPAGPLFYARAKRRSGAAAKPGKSLANDLREWVHGLGLNVGMKHRKAPNHAWRHRFTQLARRHGMDVEKREAILGHRLEGEADTYGDMEGLEIEIKKLPDPLS